MWYAGSDWAFDHHDAVVVDDGGRVVLTLRIAHTPAGLAQLTAAFSQICATTAKEQLVCIVETNRGLLIAALLQAGFAVSPVNPKTVDRRRNAAGVKTFQKDAYLLAKTGRSDLADLRRLRPDSPLVQELKALTRDQAGLIQTRTRLVNQLIACLKSDYPCALEVFSKLHQKSTIAFLRAYPTPQDARAAWLEAIAAILKAAGHTRAAQAARTIHQQLQQPHLVADAITTRTKARLLLALLAQLQPLMEQSAAYDAQIERLFLMSADSALFASLPRAGKRLAPRLLAEIGDDRTGYADAAHLQALGGSAPVCFESGNYAKAHRRYACVGPLRNAMQHFAWQSTLQEGWALAYEQRKRQEGKSHTAAIRTLANVWLRIIYALWRDHTPYVTARFEAAWQQKVRKAAEEAASCAWQSDGAAWSVRIPTSAEQGSRAGVWCCLTYAA